MSWLSASERKRKRDAQYHQTATRAVSGNPNKRRRMAPIKGRELRTAYFPPSSASSSRRRHRPALSVLRGAGGGIPRLRYPGSLSAAAGNSNFDNASPLNFGAVAFPDPTGAAGTVGAVDTALAAVDGPSTEEEKRSRTGDGGEGGKEDRRVVIDAFTLDAMRLEVVSLPLPESLHSLALALIGSDSVRVLHEMSSRDGDGDATVSPERPSARRSVLSAFSRLGFGGRVEENDDERKERRAQELTFALNKLVSKVGSITKMVTSWEEVRAALSEVLLLPDEAVEAESREDSNEAALSLAAVPALPSSVRRPDKVQPKRKPRSLSVKKYAGMIQLSRLQSMKKWKQLRATSLPPARKKELDAAASEEAEVEVVDESLASKLPSPAPPAASLSRSEDRDRLLEEKIAEAESVARAKQREEEERQDAAIAEREQREEAEAAEAEAAQAVSSLLRSLTEEEQAIVREAIYGIGPPDEILAKSDTDSCQRLSMHKLQPGVWLNDEVIHYFLLMLSRRDAKLCEADPSRKRCHFFKSFFISKLLDECGYKYSNVKRWSKKVPGKDIFKLDKIFFPINVGGMHWTSAVVYMQEKRIQYYDSMCGSGLEYLEGLFRYVKDEHQAKKGCPLPGADEWELVQCSSDTPQQENGFDCGVFTCMFCDFLSKDCPLTFSQEHVTQCRERIALSIMNGSAIE